MGSRVFFLLAAGVLSAIVLACGPDTEATGTPPVVQLMPDMAGYRVVEGETAQDYIKNLAEGAALLTLNPQMLLLIEGVDRTAACYQEAGALNMRLYSDEAFPLSSGAVAIADRNRLTDPQTLFKCVGGGLNPFSSQSEATLSPCVHSYTLERDENAFYIVYIGTTQEICSAFCAELEGCSGH